MTRSFYPREYTKLEGLVFRFGRRGKETTRCPIESTIECVGRGAYYRFNGVLIERARGLHGSVDANGAAGIFMLGDVLAPDKS